MTSEELQRRVAQLEGRETVLLSRLTLFEAVQDGLIDREEELRQKMIRLNDNFLDLQSLKALVESLFIDMKKLKYYDKFDEAKLEEKES